MKFSAQQKAAVKGCLQEISNSFTRIEAERDNIKEIIKKMADEFEIAKPISRKLAKIYHKRNLEEERGNFEEVANTYDEVTKP